MNPTDGNIVTSNKFLWNPPQVHPVHQQAHSRQYRSTEEFLRYGPIQAGWHKFNKSYRLKVKNEAATWHRDAYITLAQVIKRKRGQKIVRVECANFCTQQELTWPEAMALAVAVIRMSGIQLVPPENTL
jgi:hypothetical protein